MGLLVLLGLAAAIYLLSNEKEQETNALPKTDAVQRSSVSGGGPSKRHRKSNRASVATVTPEPTKRIAKRTIVEEFIEDGDKTPKGSGTSQSKESQSGAASETPQET